MSRTIKKKNLCIIYFLLIIWCLAHRILGGKHTLGIKLGLVF